MTMWSKMKPDQKFLSAWDEFGWKDSDMEPEYVFDKDNTGYRIDYAWPSCKVGVEIHGLGFGHQSVVGLATDCEKMRHAILMGWALLPFCTPCIASRVNAEAAIALVNELLSRRHGIVDWTGNEAGHT